MLQEIREANSSDLQHRHDIANGSVNQMVLFQTALNTNHFDSSFPEAIRTGRPR